MRTLFALAGSLLVLPLLGCGTDVSESGLFSGGNTAASTATAGVGGAASASSAASGIGGEGTSATTGSAVSSSSSSTSTSGASTSASSSTGGPSCPSGDMCSDCASMKCPDVYCACYGNLECGQLIQCDKGCMGDPACLQKCATQHQDGISALALLSDCAATSCAMSCPGNQVLKPCEKCLFTKCDIQANACLANPECTALFACVDACGMDMGCRQACAMTHQGGLAAAMAANNCIQASCSNACP